MGYEAVYLLLQSLLVLALGAQSLVLLGANGNFFLSVAVMLGYSWLPEDQRQEQQAAQPARGQADRHLERVDQQAVSYTHLDVYKRQASVSPSTANLVEQYTPKPAPERKPPMDEILMTLSLIHI